MFGRMNPILPSHDLIVLFLSRSYVAQLLTFPGKMAFIPYDDVLSIPLWILPNTVLGGSEKVMTPMKVPSRTNYRVSNSETVAL
jgi:hypothetical protein